MKGKDTRKKELRKTILVLRVFAAAVFIMGCICHVGAGQASAAEKKIPVNGKELTLEKFYDTYKNQGRPGTAGKWIYYVTKATNSSSSNMGPKYRTVGYHIDFRESKDPGSTLYGSTDIPILNWGLSDGYKGTGKYTPYSGADSVENYECVTKGREIYTARRIKISTLKRLAADKITNPGVLYKKSLNIHINSVMTTIYRGGSTEEYYGRLSFKNGEIQSSGTGGGSLARSAGDIASLYGNGKTAADFAAFYGIYGGTAPETDLRMSVTGGRIIKGANFSDIGGYFIGKDGSFHVNGVKSSFADPDTFDSNKVFPNFTAIRFSYKGKNYLYSLGKKSAGGSLLRHANYSNNGGRLAPLDLLSNSDMTVADNGTTSNFLFKNKNLKDRDTITWNRNRAYAYYGEHVPNSDAALGTAFSGKPEDNKNHLADAAYDCNTTVTCDLSAPVIAGISDIKQPEDNYEYGIQNTVNISISDGLSGIRRVTVTDVAAGTPVYDSGVNDTYANDFNGEAMISPVNTETYYRVTAEDQVGNTAESIFRVTLVRYYKTSLSIPDVWNPTNAQIYSDGGTMEIASALVATRSGESPAEDPLDDSITSLYWKKNGSAGDYADKPWVRYRTMGGEKMYTLNDNFNPYNSIKLYCQANGIKLRDGKYTFHGRVNSAGVGTKEADAEGRFDFHGPQFTSGKGGFSTSRTPYWTNEGFYGEKSMVSVTDNFSGPSEDDTSLECLTNNEYGESTVTIRSTEFSGRNAYNEHKCAIYDFMPEELNNNLVQGLNEYLLTMRDNAGNESTKKLYYRYDSVAPGIDVSVADGSGLSVKKDAGGNFKIGVKSYDTPVIVTISSRDKTSGFTGTERWDCKVKVSEFTSSPSGQDVVYSKDRKEFSAEMSLASMQRDLFTNKKAVATIMVTDQAGNTSEKTITVHVDSTPPQLFAFRLTDSGNGYGSGGFANEVLYNGPFNTLYYRSSQGQPLESRAVSNANKSFNMYDMYKYWIKKDWNGMFAATDNIDEPLKECYIECTETGNRHDLADAGILDRQTAGYSNKLSTGNAGLRVPRTGRYYFTAFDHRGKDNEVVKYLTGGKDEGSFHFAFRASDWAGNTSSYYFIIRMDNTRPEIRYTGNGGRNGYNATGTDLCSIMVKDTVSGIKEVYAKDTGTGTMYYPSKYRKGASGGYSGFGSTTKKDDLRVAGGTELYLEFGDDVAGLIQDNKKVSIYAIDYAGNVTELGPARKTDNTKPSGTMECSYGNRKDEVWGARLKIPGLGEGPVYFNSNPDSITFSFRDRAKTGTDTDVSSLAYCSVTVVESGDEDEAAGTDNGYTLYMNDGRRGGQWGCCYGDGDSPGVWSRGIKENNLPESTITTGTGKVDITIDTHKWDGIFARFRVYCADVAGNVYTYTFDPVLFDREDMVRTEAIPKGGHTDEDGNVWNPSSVDAVYSSDGLTGIKEGTYKKATELNAAAWGGDTAITPDAGTSGGYREYNGTDPIYKLFRDKKTKTVNIGTADLTEDLDYIDLTAGGYITPVENGFLYPSIKTAYVDDIDGHHGVVRKTLNIDRTPPAADKDRVLVKTSKGRVSIDIDGMSLTDNRSGIEGASLVLLGTGGKQLGVATLRGRGGVHDSDAVLTGDSAADMCVSLHKEIDTSTYAQPVDRVRLDVSDRAGNKNSYDILTAAVDRTPPSVKMKPDWDRLRECKIEMPVEGGKTAEFYSNPDTIRFTFNDRGMSGGDTYISGLAYCEVYICELSDADGEDTGAARFVSSRGNKGGTTPIAESMDSIEIEVDTSSYDQQACRFEVRAYDAAGNESVKKSNPVFFDRGKDITLKNVAYNSGPGGDSGWNPDSVDVVLSTDTYSGIRSISGAPGTGDGAGASWDDGTILTKDDTMPGGYGMDGQNIYQLVKKNREKALTINTGELTEENDYISLAAYGLVTGVGGDGPFQIKSFDGQEKINIDRTIPRMDSRDDISSELDGDDSSGTWTFNIRNVTDNRSGVSEVSVGLYNKKDGVLLGEFTCRIGESYTGPGSMAVTENEDKGGRPYPVKDDYSFTLKVAAADLPERPKWIKVRGRDAAGNEGEIGEAKVGIDPVPSLSVRACITKKYTRENDFFATSFTRGDIGYLDMDVEIKDPKPGDRIERIEAEFPENIDQPYYADRPDDGERMGRDLTFSEPDRTVFNTWAGDSRVKFFVPLDLKPVDDKNDTMPRHYKADRMGDPDNLRRALAEGWTAEKYQSAHQADALYYARIRVTATVDGKRTVKTFASSGDDRDYMFRKTSQAGELLGEDSSTSFSIKHFGIDRCVSTMPITKDNFFGYMVQKGYWHDTADLVKYLNSRNRERDGLVKLWVPSTEASMYED